LGGVACAVHPAWGVRAARVATGVIWAATHRRDPFMIMGAAPQ
jgi:hypothetical protein